MENLSAADVAAVTRPNYMGYGMCGGMGYGMGGLEGLIGLAVIALLFGGGGWGGGFGGGGNGVAAIYGAQQFSQLDNAIRNTQNGIADSTYAITNTLNGINMNLSNALCSTTYELAGKIDANRFAAQQCCCETQRAIDGVKFENAQNTCQIVNAIHAEGETTRRMLLENKIEALQCKITELTASNNAKDLALSQIKQNQYLVNEFEEKLNKRFGCGCCGD